MKSAPGPLSSKSACLVEDDVPRLRSNTPRTFDIKRDCIFCSDHVAHDSKAQYYRSAVSNVETLQFQATVLNCAKKRNDNLGNDVAERVQHTYDLVAAEAKYHRMCAQFNVSP